MRTRPWVSMKLRFGVRLARHFFAVGLDDNDRGIELVAVCESGSPPRRSSPPTRSLASANPHLSTLSDLFAPVQAP